MPSIHKSLNLFSESLPIAIEDSGEGHPFLILHGGAGPASVAGLAEGISKRGRAIVPIHPGFSAQPRPEWFRRIDDLALAYLSVLEKMDLKDVTVVGNSIGGWIAAELALRHSPRITRIVLLNAVGIDTGSEDRRIANPMEVAPEQRASYAFHDPTLSPFRTLTADAAAMMAANQLATMAYAGQPYMHDPGLRMRLAQIEVPALVLWGANDRIVDLEYGRRFADSIPGARFEVVTEAGHFPQIEKLNQVLKLLRGFVYAH